MAGIDHFDLAQFRVEAQEDGGDIAAAGLFALAPVVLVHAGCQFVEGRAGDGHGAERRAEAGGHHCRGQAFAGNVGDGDQEAAIGLLHDVEVVAANLIAGDGAEGQRVAGDVGQFLRQQRALDVAGGVKILLHARPLQVALVVAGIFKGDSGLQGQALDEVGLVNCEFAAIGRGNNQLRHALAFAILQEIDAGARGPRRSGQRDRAFRRS